MTGFEILIRIHPEKRAEFLLAYEMLKSNDQQDKDRLELELFEQVIEPNTFLWFERWTSDESLSRYTADNRYRAMMGAIDALGQMVYNRKVSIQ